MSYQVTFLILQTQKKARSKQFIKPLKFKEQENKLIYN